MADKNPKSEDKKASAAPVTETKVTGPRELPLVALRETVIFPEMIVPLQVGRDKSVAALNAAIQARAAAKNAGCCALGCGRPPASRQGRPS